MAIDFPNSPTVGQIYTVGDKSWIWDGTVWKAYGASLSPTVLKVDSTNTRVGINNQSPAYTLDVNGTVEATQFIQGSDYLTPYAGFRNAIINGDFRINQRAWSSTSGSGGTISGTYGFDRWQIVASGGTETMSSQTFTVGSPAATGYESATFVRLTTSGQSASSDYGVLRQYIEDVRTFANSTVTVSFWAKASSGTPKIAVDLTQDFGSGGSPSSQVNTYAGQVTLSTSWARYSVTVSNPNINGKTIGTTANTSALALLLWISAGSNFSARTGSLGIQNTTIDFWGVQVERGSVATPFEQRPIDTELSLCERYFQIWRGAGGSTGNQIGFGNGYNSTSIYPIIRYKRQMRIAPTAITANDLRLNDVTTAYTITAISLEQIGADGCRVNCTVASGGVQYRGYAIETNNVTTSYLGLSAEY